MKRFMIVIMLLFSLCAFAEAEFEKTASGTPEIIQKGPQKMWCPICGMNLKNYYKTSHAVELNNGNTRQYCSIRCLVNDFPNLEGQIKNILVVDAKTEKLINVKNAVYVVGSSVPGTMTKTSKIAFGSMDDAAAFQKEFGGEITDFSTAFKSAQKSMSTDVAMTTAKKTKMMYPMGESVYKSVCTPVEPANFEQINSLKAYIKDNNICKDINEGKLQAVALYLWDVVRVNQDTGYSFIKVPEDARCPVCAMFVAKYPRWAAQMTYTMKNEKKDAYFDGVKDMMKFYFEPAKWGYKGIKPEKMMVSDYYSQKAIDAKEAYYVAGSDIYGPMGEELIPFGSEDNAKVFMKDHNGKKIYRFQEISSKLLK
ncbi:MAG: nitrous oxide reductase accessory protein NosL [Deferribacterales bacterium]